MAFLSLAFVIAAIVAYGEIYAFRASAAYIADGRFIDWRSKRLHVRDLGRASKPPVLLIHGSSANGREFLQNLVPALDQDFRLLVPDRPGAGHSERPFNAARLSQQAAAMAQVLEDAGGAPAIVVGHSFGAPVGLRLAMDRPDLVKGLVLLAPVSHPWDGKTRLHNRLAANPIYGRLFARIVPFVGPAAAEGGMKNVFGPQSPPEGYAEATGLSLLFRPATFRANAQDLASINAELAAQAPRYPEIEAPTVIFSGSKDQVLSPALHARALSKEMPRVELVILPESGHMPHHYHAAEIADAVRKLRLGDKSNASGGRGAAAE